MFILPRDHLKRYVSKLSCYLILYIYINSKWNCLQFWLFSQVPLFKKKYIVLFEKINST